MLELADARSPVLLLLLHTGEGIFGIDQCKDLSDFNPFALSRSFSQQSSKFSNSAIRLTMSQRAGSPLSPRVFTLVRTLRTMANLVIEW